MSQHAGSPAPSAAPPAPEPTFAERARTLVHQARTGTLATVSRRHPGHPFASLMPHADDARGRPLLLISAMAVHTQNLLADPRASLLVTRPGATDEPLAAGRVTLMGEVRRVPQDETAEVRAIYLARHASAASWADFGDFAFWRLEVADVYFVGGFGAMGWVDAAEYAAASPDPLADAAASLVEDANRDHGAGLLACARRIAGAGCEGAALAAVDRLGFELRLRRGDHRWSVRVPFPCEVRSAAEGREVLARMLGRER